MSSYDSSAAVTSPPPSVQCVQGAVPRILHLPIRHDALPRSDARGSDRPRDGRAVPRGCSVKLHLTWSQEAEELIDRVSNAGFDTSAESERALIETILVADMAAAGAREAILFAIDEVPIIRVIAIANSLQEEQAAWEAGAHMVMHAPVDPDLLVRMLTRCSNELERDRLLRDLAEKVRSLREKEERRTEQRSGQVSRSVQRALTVAAFKAHLLSETLSANSDQGSARVQLSKELCTSLAKAITTMLDARPDPAAGPVLLELRRITELMREGVTDIPSLRRAMRDK